MPRPRHALDHARPEDAEGTEVHVVDGTGLRCVTLLLRLRDRVGDLQPGALIHVIATDPAAPLDLPAWCHLTGHAYLGPVRNDSSTGAPIYAVRTAVEPRRTKPDRPWHPA